MVWPFTKKPSGKALQDRVCIPEARKAIEEQEAQIHRLEEKKSKAHMLQLALEKRELPSFTDNKPRLYIEGVFAVAGTLMLKGTVVSGRISKSSKLKIRKKTFKVKDLQLNGRSAGSLTAGQHGAIFFEKAKGLYLRVAEIVNFS